MQPGEVNVLKNEILLREFVQDLLEKFAREHTNYHEFQLHVPTPKLQITLKFAVMLQIALKN